MTSNTVSAMRDARGSRHRREDFPILRHISRAIVALVLLLPAAGPALAASAATCSSYVKETAAKAQVVRQFTCGHDPKEARWSAEPKGHEQWCKSASEDAVAKEVSYRRGEMKLCLQCRTYARVAAESAAENGKLKCGFSGPRWSGDAQAHFGWCMAWRNGESAAGGADIAASDKTIAVKFEGSTHSETVKRLTDLAKCKLPK
jgi:hypothetical protein